MKTMRVRMKTMRTNEVDSRRWYNVNREAFLCWAISWKLCRSFYLTSSTLRGGEGAVVPVSHHHRRESTASCRKCSIEAIKEHQIKGMALFISRNVLIGMSELADSPSR